MNFDPKLVSLASVPLHVTRPPALDVDGRFELSKMRWLRHFESCCFFPADGGVGRSLKINRCHNRAREVTAQTQHMRISLGTGRSELPGAVLAPQYLSQVEWPEG